MDVADAINIMLYASPRARKRKNKNKNKNENEASTHVDADVNANVNANANPDEIVVDDIEDSVPNPTIQTNGEKQGTESGTDSKDDGTEIDENDAEKEEAEDEDEDEVGDEDSQPGCAVWDLFRARDADKIRHFLRKKFGGQVHFTDPIHSQIFYLDSDLRKELAEGYGVVSYRVYQYVVSSRPSFYLGELELELVL